MEALEELDARAKIISTILIGVSLLHASWPIVLVVGVLLGFFLLRRKAISLRFLAFSFLGLLGGLEYFLRFLALMELGLLFAETTGDSEIVGALLKFGLPSSIAVSAGIVLNGLQNLRRLYDEVSEAQAARGAEKNLTSIKFFVVPVLVGAILLGDEIGEALEARGYSGYLRLPYRGKFGREEIFLLAISVFILAVSFV